MRIFLLLLLLTSCGSNVYPEYMEFASKKCKNNKGLEFLWMDGKSHRAYCNNGAIFLYTFDHSEQQKELK